MLQYWRANVDLQIIVDVEACARYMAKYRRTGFNCETLIIANCEIISSSQKLKCKQKFTRSMTRGLVLHPADSSLLFSSQFAVSLRRYFKPTNKLPTADEAGLSANVVKEVNQVVTSALERSEASAGKNRKYTTIFTPDDRAAIGKYAANDDNSTAVNSQ